MQLMAFAECPFSFPDSTALTQPVAVFLDTKLQHGMWDATKRFHCYHKAVMAGLFPSYLARQITQGLGVC
jgi:hypothetical protein